MNKRNIVVLGASRGIGKELVMNFAKNPNNTIFALSRNVSLMQSNFAALGNVTIGFADLMSKDLHQDLDHVFKDITSIDILINNAGAIVNKPFLELSREDISKCYQTNAVGVIYGVQYFTPKMLAKGGHVVNISTMGAYQGSVKFPGLAAYSTSKAGMVSFTELFAEEFKDTAIKMNCLCLGAVQTEMLEEAFPGYKAPISPVEMADYIVDFAYHGNKYFNGKILPVSSTTP